LSLARGFPVQERGLQAADAHFVTVAQDFSRRQVTASFCSLRAAPRSPSPIALRKKCFDLL
jgi:hypothetical protein